MPEYDMDLSEKNSNFIYTVNPIVTGKVSNEGNELITVIIQPENGRRTVLVLKLEQAKKLALELVEDLFE